MVLPTPGRKVSFRDGSIKIKVKVKVLVKSSIIGSSGFTGVLNTAYQENGEVVLRTSSRIEDEALLEVDFKNDLGLADISEARKFDLFVEYIDDLTNKTFYAATSFTVELCDHLIDIVHSPQFFKPGIPYNFNVLITKIDGRPLLYSVSQVQVSVSDDHGMKILNDSYSLNPHTGGFEVETQPISLEVESLEINVTYDRVSYSRTVFKIVSSQKRFVSLSVLTPR